MDPSNNFYSYRTALRGANQRSATAHTTREKVGLLIKHGLSNTHTHVLRIPGGVSGSGFGMRNTVELFDREWCLGLGDIWRNYVIVHVVICLFFYILYLAFIYGVCVYREPPPIVGIT